MTREQKDLLLKDLCSRLPYGVKCKSKYFDNDTLSGIIVDEEETMFNFSVNDEGFITQLYCSGFKPYLFPISSMTEEQRKEYRSLMSCDSYGILYPTIESVDYLYKNHIDIREFITMGLAIDCNNLNIY